MFRTGADSNRTNGCTVTCIAMEHDRLSLLQPQTIMVYRAACPLIVWSDLA